MHWRLSDRRMFMCSRFSHHKEQDTINPLDLAQWTFFVVSRKRLECARPKRKSVALGQLLKIRPRISTFRELPAVIEREGHS